MSDHFGDDSGSGRGERGFQREAPYWRDQSDRARRGWPEREERPLQGRYGEEDRHFGFADAPHADLPWRHAGQELVAAVKRVFRGPKGYVRSDERIREDVSERLAAQYELDPSDIEVSVAEGEVTLAGMVQTRGEKFRAEEIADSVPGVKEVHNRLRLRPERSPQASMAGAPAATGAPLASSRERDVSP